MSTLRQDKAYGLSSRKLDQGGNISVFHVKLTDSAARAISIFQSSKGKSRHPTIRFNGNQGRIAVPCSEDRDEVRAFTFGLTNVARDNPHGSFECVKQFSTGAMEEQLSCVGVIQDKMTVNATDDSYDKARQTMAQVEEEIRSRGAIVIKHGGRYQGKKVTVRAPAPALANLAKHSHSSHSLLSSARKSACVSSRPAKGVFASDKRGVGLVESRPVRERLTHLLALRPYKRPELVLRLQRDGLTAADKDSLDTLLQEVARLNSRDNTYVLKESLYKELQKDWPGYTAGDQQLLKRILVRRLFQPHQTQVSPLRDTPNSSPAHAHRHSLPEDYTDPLANKKPRISHLSSKVANDKPRLARSSERRGAAKEPSAISRTPEEDNRRNSLDPRKLFDSLSKVSKEEAERPEVTERLQPPPPISEGSEVSVSLPKSKRERSPSPPTAPHLDRHGRAHKKSKHKHRDRDRDRDRDQEKGTTKDSEVKKAEPISEDMMKSKGVTDSTEPFGMFYDANVLKASDDRTDYLLKYSMICNRDQRQSYKQDFNEEYSEYRGLHARIDSVTHQFMKLDTQRKQLRLGTNKYQTIHNQILQEYRKIKKSNPNFSQDKMRCEYLHNKLAHIKKLISEYDQKQLDMETS